MSSSKLKSAPDSHSALKGRLLILTAAVMWSMSGFFAKSDVFDGWLDHEKGPAQAFWRAVFASVVLSTLR